MLYKIWGFISIIITSLVFFNWVPGYYVSWHRTNSVLPIVSVFPGQKIRLKLNFYEVLSDSEISSVKWDIGGLSADGLEPTFTLPPAKGGIYQLNVKVATFDGKIRKGHGNLYVNQDEPVLIKFNNCSKITISKNDANQNLKESSNKGVEIYSGNGRWIEVQKASNTENSVTLSLNPNENIAVYGGRMFYRVKDLSNNLSGYGTAPLQTSPEQRIGSCKE